MNNGRLNGKLILERMKELGFTNIGLAAEIGVSPSLVHQMIQGYLPRRNGDELLERLSKILQVNEAALVSQSAAS